MGEKFGVYTITERLGAGGMATVDRATVILPDGSPYEVALKRILPHLESEQRYLDLFVREATLASQLRHPNIVKVFEQGWVGTTCFIALELIHGDPLVSLMRRARLARQPVPVGIMLGLLIELCDVLDYVHHDEDERGEARRIIHRDLTPANLVVEDTGHLKVIDFGVAKATRGKHATDSGQAKGKLGYMPFEALEGAQLDARSDIYSVGVVMWELLCGRRLFKAPTEWELMEQIRAGNVPAPSNINPGCPTELDEVVLRAVSRDYIERWPSAAALRVELEHVRRNYVEASTPAAIRKWKDGLMAKPPVRRPPPRPAAPEAPEAPEIVMIHDVPPVEDEISEVSLDGFSDAPFIRRAPTTLPDDDAGPTGMFGARTAPGVPRFTKRDDDPKGRK